MIEPRSTKSLKRTSPKGLCEAIIARRVKLYAALKLRIGIAVN